MARFFSDDIGRTVYFYADKVKNVNGIEVEETLLENGKIISLRGRDRCWVLKEDPLTHYLEPEEWTFNEIRFDNPALYRVGKLIQNL